MIIRAVDSDGDWKFGKGKNDYLKNRDAIKQNTETRLKEWKGNCFFAPNNGPDYENLLDAGTKNLLDRDIKRVILQSEGIIKIKEFESSVDDDREYSATATLIDIFNQNLEIAI